MAVLLQPKYLPDMMLVLKKHLPQSIMVYQPISLIVRGLTGYDVYVDKWPDFSAVLIKTTEQALKDPDHEKITHLYKFEEAEDNVLRNLLYKSGILSQPVILFPGLWTKTLQIVNNVLCTSPEALYVEHLAAEVPLYYCATGIQLPDLPQGYSVRSLRSEDYETIITGVWYKDFDYVKSVKRMLLLEGLSVGIEDSSGQLVAWTLQHITGLLGMTYVIPEHRDKKLGKYITVALTQKMIAQDGCCMAGIDDGNSVSVALHERIGFTKMEQPFSTAFYYRKGLNHSSIEQLPSQSSASKYWK
ncbi:glycine N-acyltransferase-like [Ylistrum balloti]|uniref:glycine N-acyltransferase-like n=1 Tax=Ylistrum balloti TaxID=509963 RepID=UPI0029059F49|nr:glycine N-acyltransferase-like [Ylistrum balloti]